MHAQNILFGELHMHVFLLQCYSSKFRILNSCNRVDRYDL